LAHVRLQAFRRLERLSEAQGENQTLLGFPSRDPDTPLAAIDLSAFYNVPLSDPLLAGEGNNDLSELPTGSQVFAGTTFDVRGKIIVIGRAPDDPYPWQAIPDQVRGIAIGRRLERLHFLQAAGSRSHDIPAGQRIGHYRVQYSDGRFAEIPIRYHLDTCDWWELDHLPTQLPEAVVAWRGANPRSRAEDRTIRLFKRTWENPFPDLEVASLDFVAENAETHPFLIALTAE
jgi:hypothetical protein